MVRRTTKDYIKGLLNQDSDWYVLDVGSSRGGWKEADVYVDLKDYSHVYKDKTFVQCNVEEMPFSDNEFDFVIASHILEHVRNPEDFCKELSRVGKRGYIETPTPLWDNLVTGRNKAHRWWVTFDDIDNHIVISPKRNVVKRMMSIAQHNMYLQWFRDSAVTQLYWRGSIEIKRGESKETGIMFPKKWK